MSKKRGFMGGSDPDSTPEAVEVEVSPKAVEVPLAEAGAALTEPAPAEPIQVIALDVYCATSGLKPDQTKAFAGWARRQRLTSLTRAEWKAKWDEFQNRPV